MIHILFVCHGLNNHSTNRCYMEANKPCNSVFSLPFFLWLIGVPIFFDFLRIRMSQRNSSSDSLGECRNSRQNVGFRRHDLLQIIQGTLHFPCAGCRQLPFCGLAIWGYLALQAVPKWQVS